MQIIMMNIPLFDTELTFHLFWVQIRAFNDDDKERCQKIILGAAATLTDILNTALVKNGLQKITGNPVATFVLCVLWLG
jgi:hypothetical protein